jgi:hypothetical protein
MPTTRFTVTGSDALERRLEDICNKVLAGITRIISASKLEGIVLGGGYGRGEGGVLKTPSGDGPYNDLEFYVFVRGQPWLNERRYARALHVLSEELAPGAGIELEFKITSTARLRHSLPTLFYHDLIMGHRWLLGDDSLFTGCEHHREPGAIPLSEATRLLMNRCSGLLFAREKLEHGHLSADDADFAYRNIAKTQLALGDAVLLAFGQFHWSCRERHRRMSDLSAMADLPWLDELRQCHATGAEFKLHPHRTDLSRATLQHCFSETSSLAHKVWLWLEKRRLGCAFATATDYASSRINKWPGTNVWRNGLANASVFGRRALLMPRHRRHPRERILNALALLLWAGAGNSHETTQQAQRELLCSDPAANVSAYRARWRRAS